MAATLVFIDGNELRRAELAQIIPGAAVRLEALTAGFATSAPEPGQKARDKVAAHPADADAFCFAEAVDITTMDGKSLRLELDTENETRFCKWWRETPAKMQLRVAYRRGGTIEVLTATCEGRIADRPVGPLILGWDRLFVPDDPDAEGDTLAQLSEAGVVVAFRRAAYGELARIAGLP